MELRQKGGIGGDARRRRRCSYTGTQIRRVILECACLILPGGNTKSQRDAVHASTFRVATNSAPYWSQRTRHNFTMEKMEQYPQFTGV